MCSTSSTSNGRRKANSTPSLRVRLLRKPCANESGRYPSSAAASRTRRRVASEAPSTPRSTIETSGRDTPTWRAMSAIVGRRNPFGSPACFRSMPDLSLPLDADAHVYPHTSTCY